VSEARRNPLFSAIIGGYTEVAKVLIESGMDTTIKYSNEYIYVGLISACKRKKP